ncbi:MAG TPA: AmmeMemoRadiSam system protein B [Candidatus Acidoferrum sp.]|nr:AmmeMemoRadiSam system protein B [Candidatus Acidoferrum sp.]
MLSLSDRQERAIHHAASERVAAAVMRRPVNLADATLGGAAGEIVTGAFVTLKRRGRLRGCCGLFGAPMTLGEALGQAARRTATEDARFPPVSPTELPFLELEVWLLENPKPVTAPGRDRAAEISIGRHGLHIRRGNAGGLLLPGVAVENHLDAEGFLELVCHKANLPPTAWQEADTQLVTFEGQAIGGPVGGPLASEAALAPVTLLDATGAAKLAEHCRRNVWALLQGTVAGCYSLECPDGTAHGVSLAVHLPGGIEILRASKLSLRPGLPLQATLHSLAAIAARSVAPQGPDPQALAGLRAQVTVLWDPAMHGTVLEPDLDGVDSARRALLVLEGTKWAWVYDPQQSPAELLTVASREAQVKNPAAAEVVSLAAESTEASASVREVPRPQMGPRLRPPAVAGSFYPGQADTLWKTVDGMIPNAPRHQEDWPAVLVPHAGLQYSGRIAAAVLGRVEIPDVVIVLGPRHTQAGMEWAVAPHEAWSLPGATVASDPALARHLAAAIPDLHLDARAHEQEHCIEVQLPFLARFAPQTRVVGIVLGGGDLDRCRQFAGGLAEVLRGLAERPLLMISSDLNHYASEVENRRLDAIALAALEGLDPAAIYATMVQRKISMCGLLPAVIVLETLRQLGTLRRCQRVAYATSADVSGDTSRVVGYAGMLFG